MTSAWQKHVQSVLRKGGTMKQAAASWHRSSKPSKVRHMIMRIPRGTAAARKGGNRSMGKKGGHRSGGFNTSKLFKLARMAAFVAPGVIRAIEPGVSGTVKGYHILSDYTGFDAQTGKWNAASLQRGWLPFIATSAITYGIPKLMQIIRRL